MYEELRNFLSGIGECFIEAEAKQNQMNTFINEYNKIHTKPISLNTEGIIVLQNNANKWGMELRLYVKVSPPKSIKGFHKHNRSYKSDYPYRLDDNATVNYLLANGYDIGRNR